MKRRAGRVRGVRDPHNGEGCKLPTCGIRETAPALPEVWQLKNKVSVLVADKGLGALPRADPELAEPEPQRHKRQSIHSNRRNYI